MRNRRPGDRFRPGGARRQGQKLQDLFRGPESGADRLRDAVPLVVDETDQIVWVAGYGIDEAFQVTDPVASRANLETYALRCLGTAGRILA